MSRARLGLYIFGRRSILESCPELKPASEILFQRPDKLQLVTGEMFPAERGAEDEVSSSEMDGVEHLGQYVYEMTQAKAKAMREEGSQLPQRYEKGYIEEDEDEDVAVPLEAAEGGGDDDEGDDSGFIPLEADPEDAQA